MNKVITKSPNNEFDKQWRRQYSSWQAIVITDVLANLLQKEFNRDVVGRAEGEDEWVNVYSTKTLFQSYIDNLFESVKNNHALVENLIGEVEKSGSAFSAFAQKQQFPSKKSTDELLDIFSKFTELFSKYLSVLWKTFALGEAGTKLLEYISSKYMGGLPIEKLSEKLHPSGLTHVFKVGQYFAKHDDISLRVRYLTNNFPWLFTTDPFSPVATKKDVEKFARTYAIMSKEKIDDIELKLNDDAKKNIGSYRDILFLKDKRDEFRRQAFYYIRPVIVEIARRFSVKLEDLWFVRPDELVDFDKKNLEFISDLENRKQGYLYEVKMPVDEKVFSSGKKVKDFFFKEEIDIGTSHINGIIGMKGIAKGIVRVIANSRQLKDLEKGGILVATTTNPDYITAMQKAAAFVTDEGGITCHAAIIAREMKKPCIIGTKIATKVLKDGDLVEVNANEGTIKIIKRAN